MSKTDPSSSNAAGDKRPARADGDAGRLDNPLAEEPEQAMRPASNLDDNWALSSAMAVPQVPGLTDSSDATSGDTDALYPAPPMIPAATPSGPGSAGEPAAASVVARAAALRALGGKTMQGFGPAPINKAGGKAGGATGSGVSGVSAPSGSLTAPAQSSLSGADLEEEPTAFTSVPAPHPTIAAPGGDAAQAPLYLDDPPDMLRLSTGTSDISVPEVDPGVSASIAANADELGDRDDHDDHDEAQDDDLGEDDEDDGRDATEDSVRHDAHDPPVGLHVRAAYSVDSAPYPPDSGVYPESSEPFQHDSSYSGDAHDQGDEQAHHDGQHAGYDDGGYRDSAPEALLPVVQLLAPTTATRRAYGDDGVPPAESEWFEPSGAQAVAHPSQYGHTAQQHDHSFTEPSRRDRAPGPNRWIAPVAVVVALAAVVFAGGYFYTRGGPSAQNEAQTSPTGASSGSSATSAKAGQAADAGGQASSGAAAAGTLGGDGAAADNGGAAPSSTVAAGLVDVRFDSTPPGAMVMVVDRGRGITSPVGTTPVRAALEPRGIYDAIFTLEGHPTKVISLAGVKAARVVADLSGAAGEQVAANPTPGNVPPGTTAPPASEGDPRQLAETEGPKASPGDKRDPRSNRRDKQPRSRPGSTNATGGSEAADEPDETSAAEPNDNAMGRLSISAKPACEIVINGKATGRTTPVRDLPLSVGIHKITFINKSLGVNETIAVRVTAGKETKVAQDYTGTP